MGDIIEITTRAHHPVSFYQVTSSFISFEIKGPGTALIGLTSQPGEKCSYWFGFGQGGRVWIKDPDGLKTSHHGNLALSPDTFRRFWVGWGSGHLRIGQGRDTSPLVTYAKSCSGLQYVTFTSNDQANSITWRLELPPAALIKSTTNVQHKPLCGGEPQWVIADGELPLDAVIGGFEGETMYVIRARIGGSVTPGKYVPSVNTAYIPWGGMANPTMEFEILCGTNFAWQSTCDDKIPLDAFVAGTSEVNNETLYIGRVYHDHCMIPGKVQPSHKVCYAAIGDREVPFKSYEILIVPYSNIYASGHYMETNVDWNDLTLHHGFRNNRHQLHYPHPMEQDEDEDTVSEEDDDFDGGVAAEAL